MKEKSFVTLTPGVRAIKHGIFVTDSPDKKARVFLRKKIQPNLIFRVMVTQE